MFHSIESSVYGIYMDIPSDCWLMRPFTRTSINSLHLRTSCQASSGQVLPQYRLAVVKCERKIDRPMSLVTFWTQEFSLSRHNSGPTSRCLWPWIYGWNSGSISHGYFYIVFLWQMESCLKLLSNAKPTFFHQPQLCWSMYGVWFLNLFTNWGNPRKTLLTWGRHWFRSSENPHKFAAWK